MSLQCPTCRVSLHKVPNRVGLAAACATCGGLWLDNACSRSVAQGLVEPAVKYAAEQADAIAAKADATNAGGYRQPAPRPASDAPRLCVACGVQLSPSLFEPARIMLDVCPAHGTWFDAGELKMMSQHFEIQASLDEPDVVAFGEEMQAYRDGELARDFGAVAAVLGILRR